ncbi:MAG: hypothetical protein ACYC96_01035 [Fimbriimonadaceae bacterium]
MLFRPILLLVAAFGARAQQANTFAATFPQRLEVEVCGQPALPSTVASAVEGAIRVGLKGAPHVDLTFDNPPCRPLFPDQRATYLVRVVATAPNRDEASGNVAVAVRNSGEEIGHEPLLWFCNKPENLQTSGPLFDGNLAASQPIRLLYHHQNRGTQPLYMRIELVNDSDTPARAWIISGNGRPNRDPVWSGLRAAREYLPALLTGSGELITLPPHSARPIAFRRLVMGDTASGLCTLKLQPGGPTSLEVRAEAIDPVALDSAWTSATMDSSPWHWVPPHPLYPRVKAAYTITPLIYLDPLVGDSVSASIGGAEAVVRFGVEGIARQGGGRGLNGNYGVLHTFQVNIANPTRTPGKVEFWLDATTNYTSAIFAFPTCLFWLRPLQKHESREFLSIPLAPGEHRTFKVRTIPISGGWYPATLRLKPVAGA